ncbi:uncharacterized protein [Battus philenor]|uniref:uncharacterized protein n=1 Tax=Battus philenor TaxID=42288 RepID=UPI0035CFDB02
MWIGRNISKSCELISSFWICLIGLIQCGNAQCSAGESLSFIRWSGVAPERAIPVFMYSASGEEDSLTGVCLSRCRELVNCAAVVVEYGKGTCQGITQATGTLNGDNDVAYFTRTCLKLPEECERRWWALESTPSYYLHSEGNGRTLVNVTIQQCYEALLSTDGKRVFRSAQWVEPENLSRRLKIEAIGVGNCLLNEENKFTEPESYRVSNYYTFYIENHCGHDYSKRIDRCSYEEYYNQTLKHIDFTMNNVTKDECKTACELEDRFICRGFTWTSRTQGGKTMASRGLCDLHSEDLVTAGSWLLRRATSAIYYRRVICLNISVECQESDMLVTYRPRGVFRGRVYVPGRGAACGARGTGSTAPVKLTLPLQGDCDVNFAYGITNSPGGVINRTMAYVMVMIQNNPIIQTAGDRWVRVGCSPGSGSRSFTKVDAIVAVKDTSKPSLGSESQQPGASAVYGAGAPLRMHVVRAGDGPAASTAALGELLELRIETTDETEIEAYHLVASSRLGDSSVLLLDSAGCPTGQVDFPAFTRTHSAGTQRLSARFKAFRFPNSHVVRFALMVRFCEVKCKPVNCRSEQIRTSRQTNLSSYDWHSGNEAPAAVRQELPWETRAAGVVAQGGAPACVGANSKRVPLELEMVVGSRDVLSADTLVKADHQAAMQDQSPLNESLVCIHELLLVSLVLAWLAVQIILLLGCCVLVKRYRNLAEMSMQKDYQSFDNVGFETSSTHRRVHWPDQTIEVLHT